MSSTQTSTTKDILTNSATGTKNDLSSGNGDARLATKDVLGTILKKDAAVVEGGESKESTTPTENEGVPIVEQASPRRDSPNDTVGDQEHPGEDTNNASNYSIPNLDHQKAIDSSSKRKRKGSKKGVGAFFGIGGDKDTAKNAATFSGSSSARKQHSDSLSTDETAKNLLEMIIQEKSFAVSFLHLQSIPALLLESRDVQNNLEVLHLEFTDISVIPLDLMNFMKLKSLNLSHNKIQYIPEEIVNLGDMTYLNLSNNDIEEVPVLSGLDLRYLNLGGNHLSDVEDTICDMKQLEYLNLANNKLRQLASNIGDLSNLRELHIQDNYLTSLPSEICSLTNLTVLYVNRNHLRELPMDFHSSMRRLHDLNVSRNYLTEKTLENFSKMSQLRAYLLGSNRIRELPRGTSCFDTSNVEIRMVDLSNNKIHSFPTEIRRSAKTLLHLDLRNNYIQSMTTGIKYLAHLKRLDMSRNKLKTIPAYFSRLISLQLLRMSHNQVSSIHPDAFSGLKDLEEIQLDHNDLIQLPQNLGDLKKLARLMLQYNKLKELPEMIGDCPLYHLDISNNELHAIPVTLGQCITLHKLVFNDNLIEQNPNQLTRLSNLQFVNCKNNPFMKNFTHFRKVDEAREKVVAQSLIQTLNDLEMEATDSDKQLTQELAHRMQQNIDQRSLEEILELPDTQPLTCSVQ
uniref:Disease resistance R13L4/SHOC-2-like LRR domain-containing protein n=1 Tax=Percolomonas cosmopolitus TaxID=63605 RepID=A0A7S1KLM5_9EUKA|mmetsp:Transcript_11262/g.42175  ORF Transcript_11262/g.42175 Transcript_11262/m.42175 type:complete len:683 (+) Transcript_11262:136-2184(+)|eukprot:CAMPEP_0117434600 /NCGR_PEP_ID=MMETSP0759-20121206/36_1 /TAXON_ID=63605 /ORGANISM="Percolomonas cosmopolitus, Strain WS" /LENGTH=682 /DNA_ID=CAMNT_0005226095 /DNA_START=67 /DNA_END=2115 /DNA_ORIENTATION=-